MKKITIKIDREWLARNLDDALEQDRAKLEQLAMALTPNLTYEEIVALLTGEVEIIVD